MKRAAVAASRAPVRPRLEGVPAAGVEESKAAGPLVNPGRVRVLKEPSPPAPDRSGPVVYWMSRDQRVNDNWALLHAQELARDNARHAEVVFCLVPKFPSATIRHYGFMLGGLQEVEAQLNDLKIPFSILFGTPEEVLPRFVDSRHVHTLVCDFSPLRVGKAWKQAVASRISVPTIEVDAHNVVPAWQASEHLEYAARTIRPKIQTLLPAFLTEFPAVQPQTSLTRFQPSDIDWKAVHDGLVVDRSVPQVSWCKPGATAAAAQLQAFLKRINRYDKDSNDPTAGAESELSPYLHFGQIGAQRVALDVSAVKSKCPAGAAAFLEQIIVRRELAENYCYYNPMYDNLGGLYPQFNNDCWAQRTLAEHAKDPRQYLYTLAQLEAGDTHDALWNAAQLDMVHNGKMPNFLRMYWGKKILEWTESPAEALRIAIHLNDKYQLDGRDPNGYVGCAWAIAGVHDNGWAERPVFGKIRYMNYEGCKRKFDVAKYIANWRTRYQNFETTRTATAAGAAAGASAAPARNGRSVLDQLRAAGSR